MDRYYWEFSKGRAIHIMDRRGPQDPWRRSRPVVVVTDGDIVLADRIVFALNARQGTSSARKELEGASALCQQMMEGK